MLLDWTAYRLNVAKEKVYRDKEKLGTNLGLEASIIEPSLKGPFLHPTLNRTSKTTKARFFKALRAMELKIVQEVVVLKQKEMEQAIARVNSLEASKSTEYFKVTKLRAQMEV